MQTILMSLVEGFMFSEDDNQQLSFFDSQLLQIFFIQNVERWRYFSRNLLQNYPSIENLGENKLSQFLDETIFGWMVVDWVCISLLLSSLIFFNSQMCDFPDVSAVELHMTDFEQTFNDIPDGHVEFCQQFPDILCLQRVNDEGAPKIRCGDLDFKINNECIKLMFNKEKFGVDEQSQKRRDDGL